jgi:hypothetical protein
MNYVGYVGRIDSIPKISLTKCIVLQILTLLTVSAPPHRQKGQAACVECPYSSYLENGFYIFGVWSIGQRSVERHNPPSFRLTLQF